MYKFIIALIVIGLSIGLYVLFSGTTSPINQAGTNSSATSTADTTIVAFGDSLTAGYNLPENEAYPAQLEDKFIAAGYSVRVINSGVSGETSRGNLERAPFIRTQNPAVVLLGIGGNDALRSLSVSETKSNIEKTIQILQSGDNPPVVYLLQMQAPLNSGADYKQSFDALYSSLAQTYDIELTPFLTEEIFLNPANVLSDGIHLNKKGYGLVVDQHIYPAVLRGIRD